MTDAFVTNIKGGHNAILREAALRPPFCLAEIVLCPAYPYPLPEPAAREDCIECILMYIHFSTKSGICNLLPTYILVLCKV